MWTKRLATAPWLSVSTSVGTETVTRRDFGMVTVFGFGVPFLATETRVPAGPVISIVWLMGMPQQLKLTGKASQKSLPTTSSSVIVPVASPSVIFAPPGVDNVRDIDFD